MTIDCQDPLDAIGFGITRIRELGVRPSDVTRHNQELLRGDVCVIRRLQNNRLYFAVVPPQTRWATVLCATGLK